MENAPSLIIKSNRTTLFVAAKNGDNYAEHDIQVKFVLGYYWNKGLPVVEKFIELIESVIKRAVSQVFSHDVLAIEYDISTNDSLEDSSSVNIYLKSLKADNIEFKIVGEVIALGGIDNRNTISKITSFRRKINESIKKEI
ncbi:hypothetical protein [Methanobrevibacter filiformis]|uniref:Uncharacterized protein n=1 Tax=Methanobrevibacter filiformis TaxID=55758 RepID=A0A166AA04_9EURY|nr:hypothetical protein [Methanobrevibacter filiformis]KZX11769.1 hypothetical protein MBFIL_13310 [Methanobrevibacter filiformis]